MGSIWRCWWSLSSELTRFLKSNRNAFSKLTGVVSCSFAEIYGWHHISPCPHYVRGRRQGKAFPVNAFIFLLPEIIGHLYLQVTQLYQGFSDDMASELLYIHFIILIRHWSVTDWLKSGYRGPVFTELQLHPVPLLLWVGNWCSTTELDPLDLVCERLCLWSTCVSLANPP